MISLPITNTNSTQTKNFNDELFILTGQAFYEIRIQQHQHDSSNFSLNFFHNIMVEKRIFRGATCGNYSLEEKQAIAIVVNKCKEEYDYELERMKGKAHWDAKRIPFPRHPGTGISRKKQVRLFYSNLAGVKNSDRLFDSAVKRKYLKGEVDSTEKHLKKHFRVARGGRKVKAPDVLDENETCTLFLPYRSKLMSTVSESRGSVKKWISKPRNLQKDSDEKS
ncbi:Hypothetical predicted protein [Octopus vulgaris]|uniref:Uncharacterized protein n=1 Tax=Octopus vulgaris TaxID=6645 RepID=A0AA36APQ9_OCTVU|nr:Hypothetical predicted protein [Octopus vulgaris]